MVVAGIPVVAHSRVEQRVGRVVGGVGAVGEDAVAVRVAGDLVVLAAVLGAGGDCNRAGPRRKRFAIEVDAGHVLGLARVLLRAVGRRDVAPGRLVHRHVADDVERPAASGSGYRVTADDGAVGRAHGVDGRVVARIERHVMDDDVGAVDAVFGVGVIRPFLAAQLELAVGADDHPLHFAGGMDIDIFREHGVGRAVLEAGDIVGGARGNDGRRQVGIVAADVQVGVLGRARIRREVRFDLAVVGGEVDLVVGADVETHAGITYLAREVHGQVGAGAHAAAQVTTDAERVDAVGHRPGTGRHAIGAVIELVRLAIGAKCRALQRSAGDQAKFRILVLLGMLDGRVLRLAVVGLAQGTDLERRVLVPGAAIRPHFAEAGRLDTFLAAIFRAGRHVQAVVHERLAPGCLQRAVLVVVVPGHAAFDIRLETLEFLVGDEVDHAADGVRTIRGRGAAGDHVHPLDQQLRELAHVGHAGDIGAHHALAVKQGQGTDRTEAAQAQRTQPLHAAAGAVGAGGAAGAALQGRQFGNRVEQVGFGGLGQVLGAKRRGGRRLRETARGDARAGNGHHVFLRHLGNLSRRRLDGCRCWLG